MPENNEMIEKISETSQSVNEDISSLAELTAQTRSIADECLQSAMRAAELLKSKGAAHIQDLIEDLNKAANGEK